MNTHEGHTATCACCTYFKIWYDGGFSEYTPGSGLVYQCNKGVWDEYGVDDIEAPRLHQLMLHAAECAHFVARGKV